MLTATTSPPYDSTMISCSASWAFVLSISAPGASILLIATMIGTPAAFAWSIASSVCGITPSSAATTRTAMSVTRAPFARICVNAA